MDDLLLPEVDHELDDLELEPGDDANLITSVEVTNEWTNFRQNFADDITMAEGGVRRNYTTWDDEMDGALLEVLVDHHNNGDHSQNGWKPHVYCAAIRNVKEKCNKDITKDNILGRLRTFDRYYEVITKILSQSGFGWDWVNHKLSMDSDDVWIKYVEVTIIICTFMFTFLVCHIVGQQLYSSPVCILPANKKEKGLASYKTKVVKHWESISIIYSKDHANVEGAMTGAKTAVDLEAEPIEISPEVAPKRQRTGESIMCMIGEMRATFKDALKTTDPLPLPKATTPAAILAALQLIPDLAEPDMLRSYGKLILNERLFEALMELPMEMRKAWLLVLP
ncbi:hypothetical protein ACQJBY_046286 [Aegilops geniculata]